MMGRQTLSTPSAGMLFFLIAFAALNHVHAVSDFRYLNSQCGLECARSGLISCSLQQIDCLCNSPSWFDKFNPCTFSQCPADVRSILQDTISICNSATLTASQYYTSFTSSASRFIATYTTAPSVHTTAVTAPATTSVSSASDYSSAYASDSTATSTPSTTGTPGSPKSGMSVGAIAGIAIAGAVIVVIIVVSAFFIYRRNHKKPPIAAGVVEPKPTPPAPPQYAQGYAPVPVGSPVPFNSPDQRMSYFPPQVGSPVPGQGVQQDYYYSKPQGGYGYNEPVYEAPAQVPQGYPPYVAEVEGSAASAVKR